MPTKYKSFIFHLLQTLVISAAVFALLLFFFKNNNSNAVSKSADDTSPTINKLLKSADRQTFKVNNWYTEQDLEKGKVVFNQQCAVCHGRRAEGDSNWKIPNSDGTFNAPPLNGSGHAWHHSLPALYRTVTYGVTERKSAMPSFSNILQPEERIAVLAYISALWPSTIYTKWYDAFKPSRNQLANQK